VKYALLALTLFAVGCGGGSSPTSLPSISPTATPTNAPTSTNSVKSAPLSSAPTTASSARHAQAGSTLSGANLLIESTGAIAQVAGTTIVWVSDTAGNDVTESSVVQTTTNGLLVDNPSTKPLVCTGSVTSSAWCAAHPQGWFFGTDSGLVKPVGQQTITLTFGDGTVGTITDDVFNGFSLACGQSMEYQSALPVVVTSNADVTYNCANQSLDFPHGVVLAAAPQADSFGRTNTIISTVTAAVAVPNGSPISIPFANVQQNAVYVFATSDGGFAKILASGVGGGGSFQGLSLHAQVNGSYAY